MGVLPSRALEGIPPTLRIELLSEFDKMMRNYRESRWEPSELDGAKFSEVVYSVVRGFIEGNYPTSAHKPANFPEACRHLEQSNKSSAPHSIRILIPRVLPGLYDVRNNRGVGHVGGDVKPNRMDATLVVEMARWVLAELVRVFHEVTVEQAQSIVDGLADRMVPLVWELPDGRMRILNPNLSMRERMLVVLYSCHPEPLSEGELVQNVEAKNATSFRRDVLRPAHKKALVDYDDGERVVRLSPMGIREVEDNIDLQV
ncbi:hypothetical protein [Candidatus Poriferisocius sp.]|uniref:hypothetical protein n=1 Tax=Candidatus Poriferisocius sp. TaxID=3101276 RepID=UPI003B02C7D1